MVHRLENGRPNVLSHLIQRRSRRARPTRRPQSHLPLRWSRICSKYDHQSAACPLEACREDEDCSMRACFLRMSPQPFGHIIAKYWKAATGSNHPCDHSVESAADGHSSLEAHSNGRRGGEPSEMRRCGAAHAEFGHVTGHLRRGLAKLANLENRPGLDDRKSVGPTVLPGSCGRRS